MKIHDVEQGSPAWRLLRAGIPCASEFHRIITPSGEPSKSQDKFICALIAERLMGGPRREIMSEWMRRGKELEAQAAASYEFQRDVETVPIGFVTNDAGTAGASPDRFVGDDGMLEVKVPNEENHVSYLIKDGEEYKTYKVQCQSQLYIAERAWTDIISHHPLMPQAQVRIYSDNHFIEKLDKELRRFLERLEERYAGLVKDGLAQESWAAAKAGGAIVEGASPARDAKLDEAFDRWIKLPIA